MNVNISTHKIKKIIVNLKENKVKEGKEAPRKSDLTAKLLCEKNENELDRIVSHKFSLLKTKAKFQENKTNVENLFQESKENNNILNAHRRSKQVSLVSQINDKSNKEIRNTIREANEYLEIQENTKIIHKDKLQTRFCTYERKLKEFS
jgi:hypothetical protein